MKPYRIFVRRALRNESNFAEVADTLDEACETVKSLAALASGFEDDDTRYLDVEDELLIVDANGGLLSAWRDGGFVQVGSVEPFEAPAPYFIGMDVTDVDGQSIFGTERDPWGLRPGDLIRNEAAEVAKEWVKDNLGFRLAARFQGDVREEKVYHVMPTEPRMVP